MPKENEREMQTLKFLQWVDKHAGYWYLICTPNEEHMSISMMQRLIVMLAKEGFYEIIFVLWMVHRDEPLMDNVGDFILLDMLIAEWKARNKDKIIKKLRQQFD